MLSLTNIILPNLTLITTEYLWKLYIKLNIIQQDVNPIYHDIIYLCKNIIQIYRNHPAFTADFNNSSLETSDFVNNLDISIINYKIEYKYSSLQNCLQFNNNEEDNKIFFTNRHYWRDRLMYSQYRSLNLLSSHLLYWLKIFKYIKKCFICRKISCWSTHHT